MEGGEKVIGMMRIQREQEWRRAERVKATRSVLRGGCDSGVFHGTVSSKNGYSDHSLCTLCQFTCLYATYRQRRREGGREMREHQRRREEFYRSGRRGGNYSAVDPGGREKDISRSKSKMISSAATNLLCRICLEGRRDGCLDLCWT